MRGNTAETAAPIATSTCIDQLDAYDRLPASVRAWLRSSILSWDAITIHDGLAMFGERRLLEIMEQQQRSELRSFAVIYQQRHGTPYPATAAGVAPLGDAR